MDYCFTLKSSFGAWCNILFASRFQRRGQQKRGSKDPKPKFVASLDSSWIKVDECPLPQLSLDTFGLNWPSRWSFWSLEFEKFKGAWTLSFCCHLQAAIGMGAWVMTTMMIWNMQKNDLKMMRN